MAKTSNLLVILLTVALAGLWAEPGWGQAAIHWSTYKLADGLAEPVLNSISFSPQGRLIATSRGASQANELDGYSVSNFPAPAHYTGRISESPGGQRWALTPGGLMEMRDGTWQLHPVPEIAAAFHSGPMPGVEGFPFFAARQGCVVVLLPTALMEFSAEDPDAPRSMVLRRAEASQIGNFTGMAVAHDGNLWLTGEHGVARLAGPVRNLGPNTAWQEYAPPAGLQIENLRRPEPDDAGGITLMAESALGRQPVVVMFDGASWTSLPAGTGNFQRAWRGPDGVIWAATGESIFQWAAAQTNWLESEEISPGQIFDVAVEPGGAFWLATSDGLFRGALPMWCPPDSAGDAAMPVSCLALNGDGWPCYISGDKLHIAASGMDREIMLPATPEPTDESLYAVKNGTLLLDLSGAMYQFDPADGSFKPLFPHHQAGKIKPLGALPDGSVCLWLDAGTNYFDSFDGVGLHPLADAPMQKDDDFNTLFVDGNGDIWVGGEREVWWRHGGGWQRFASDDHTTPENTVGFAQGPEGRVWCATLDGIWAFDGKNWIPMHARFNHINALVRSHDGSMWVASNSGLFRFCGGAWVPNGVEEGLPNGAIRGLGESQRGQLWAGTGRGLSRFRPEADPDAPRTFVRQLTGENRTLSEGDTMEVAFRGADKWKYSRQLLYSFQLDQQGWSPFREAMAFSIPHPAAGRHYFQVRAMDGNGNVDPVPAALNFTVMIPWYRDVRWWIIFLPGMMAALFFAAVAWNRHRQLVRSHAAVELKVAERTRELEIATRELLHSQKMTALGTLAAGIAHDFNNILSIIKGSAQIIEDNLDEPGKIRTRVDRIKTVVQQGAEIVDAMLGFSRGSETAARCDVNMVVAETLKLLGDRFLREVEMKFERTDGLPEIEAPKEFIQQILLNIIFNAAEAMTGRKRITLKTLRVEKPPREVALPPGTAAEYVLISVQDWGGGMTPEIKARIFEPFFTTKALSTRRGTGLGLSMVYELAKKMGAGLAVQSVPNEGSIFTLILPLRSEPKPDSRGRSPAEQIQP
jgi:signal transduction histidine kinase